jgi:hypothetical protein
VKPLLLTHHGLCRVMPKDLLGGVDLVVEGGAGDQVTRHVERPLVEQVWSNVTGEVLYSGPLSLRETFFSSF